MIYYVLFVLTVFPICGDWVLVDIDEVKRIESQTVGAFESFLFSLDQDLESFIVNVLIKPALIVTFLSESFPYLIHESTSIYVVH